VTNDVAILVPYEITLRCFSAELATLLAGFANTPHGIIVKGVNIEPAATTVLTDAFGGPEATFTPRFIPAPVPERRPMYGEEGAGAADAAFRSRYGTGRMPIRPTPVAPTPVPMPVAVSPRPGLQPFLQENQLKVTLLIHVVRLIPQT
jgi:hypothetical protein